MNKSKILKLRQRDAICKLVDVGFDGVKEVILVSWEGLDVDLDCWVSAEEFSNVELLERKRNKLLRRTKQAKPEKKKRRKSKKYSKAELIAKLNLDYFNSFDAKMKPYLGEMKEALLSGNLKPARVIDIVKIENIELVVAESEPYFLGKTVKFYTTSAPTCLSESEDKEWKRKITYYKNKVLK